VVFFPYIVFFLGVLIGVCSKESIVKESEERVLKELLVHILSHVVFFFPCKLLLLLSLLFLCLFFFSPHIAISLIIAIIERFIRKAHKIAQVFFKFCCMLNGFLF